MGVNFRYKMRFTSLLLILLPLHCILLAVLWPRRLGRRIISRPCLRLYASGIMMLDISDNRLIVINVIFSYYYQCYTLLTLYNLY